MKNFDGNLAALNTYQAEVDKQQDAEDLLAWFVQVFLDACYSALVEGHSGAVHHFEEWVSENPEVLTRLLVKAQMTKKVDNEMFMDLSDYAFRDLLGDIDNPEDIDDACKVLGLV